MSTKDPQPCPVAERDWTRFWSFMATIDGDVTIEGGLALLGFVSPLYRKWADDGLNAPRDPIYAITYDDIGFLGYNLVLALHQAFWNQPNFVIPAEHERLIARIRISMDTPGAVLHEFAAMLWRENAWFRR